MKFFSLPKCPYCGQKVGIYKTWLLRRQGEHHCKKCGNYSTIKLKKYIYILALLAVLFSALVLFFEYLSGSSFSIESIIFALIPFILFFVLSEFMIYLQPFAKPAEVSKKTSPPTPKNMQRSKNYIGTNSDISESEDLSQTKIL